MTGYLIGLGEWQSAKDIAEKIVLDPTVQRTDPLRWQAADAFASAVLYGADREAVPRAIETLNAVIADFPDVITLRGTLGGLLFEAGRVDAAETTLKEVVAKSSAAIDQGISSAYLARIAGLRGASEEARTLAETAMNNAGHMPIVKRILAELREPQLPT